MSAEKEVIYWAKVTHADEYLDARMYGDDLEELEERIDADAWTQVDLIKQDQRTSMVMILEGKNANLFEVVSNQFIVSEQ